MKKEMLEIVCDEARKKLDDQLSATDSIDQKIGTILGFVGIASVLAFNNVPSKYLAFLFYLLSQISLIISIFILFFGYRSIRLETGLSIKGYLEEIKELENEKDLTRFIEDRVLYFEKAIDMNNDLMKQKRIYLAYGTVMLLIGIVFYAIHTLV